MHKTGYAPTNNAGPRGKSMRPPIEPTESLNPILRLRQIAEELRAAAKRNDLEVVSAAASLLEPTLARCGGLAASDPRTAGAAAEIALQIRTVLTECQAILTSSAHAVSEDMKRIRHGKRTIAGVRRPLTGVLSARKLDSGE